MINEKYKMTFHFDLIDLEFNMFCFIYQSCVNVSLLLENPKSRIACQTQDKPMVYSFRLFTSPNNIS